MIILDTNVVSEAMRPMPEPSVLGWLNGQNPMDVYLTTINLAELRLGLARLDEGRRKADLEARLERMLAQVFPKRILPFSEVAARLYADRMAVAQRLGLAVGMADGMISGIALASSFAVAGRDTAPFAAMGVPVINPWAAQ